MKPAWLERKIPPVGVAAGTAGLMWLVAALAPGLTFDLPGRLLLASLFIVGGLVFGLAGVVSFRRAKTTVNPVRVDKASALVTSGVYRATRNPMYLGLLAGLVAWGILLHNPLALAVVPLFIAYMNAFQILPEERALQAIFGEGYERYRQRTRRWL